MSKRRFIPAIILVSLFAGAQQLRAQAPSASGSASSKASLPVRDFESQPPKKLGTKLEPSEGWDTAARPKLLREHIPGHASSILTPERCELRVKNDWLRVWCKAPTGRVNQLAGDTANVVIHISNQILPTGKPGHFDDQRRLALYVRLVPGEVTVVEATIIETGGYSGDWEGSSSLLTVDWSDTERGPRILMSQPGMSYMF